MLDTKTRGNLTEDETRLLNTVLYELRMQYVQLVGRARRAAGGRAAARLGVRGGPVVHRDTNAHSSDTYRDTHPARAPRERRPDRFERRRLPLLINTGLTGPRWADFATDPFALRSADPAIYQFITYQFRHGDVWHLLGNMLFLWVFGNSVNSKMGDWAYVVFYLAGGVFAAWGYAMLESPGFTLVGASGSIAAITTAYLVLYPRSRVTVLLWFFLIHFFELPAMIIIGVKIVLWDKHHSAEHLPGGQRGPRRPSGGLPDWVRGGIPHACDPSRARVTSLTCWPCGSAGISGAPTPR